MLKWPLILLGVQHMKLKLYLLAFCMLPFLSNASSFVAGVDYNIVKVNVPASMSIDKHTVIEFFNPGCPACFAAETYVQSWLKQKPASVKFERIPAVFHQEWQIYAKAFYIAEAFNKENIIVPLMFKKIHVEHEALNTPEALEPLFIAQGISKRDFNNAFAGSPSLDQELKNGTMLMTLYKIYEIPTFVVAGKYYTSPSMAGSDARMMQIVSFLVKKAQTS